MENMFGKINGAFRSMGMGVKKPDRALRLVELMSDSLHIHFLSKYAASKGQCDILIMWIECEQYKAANAKLLRRHKAGRVIKAYIETGVLDEMGASEVKEDILSGYDKEDPAPHLFDPLQLVIEGVIERDLLPGFYESSSYKELFAANGDFSAVLSAEDFDVIKFLGAGGFGMVLLVRRKATQRLYAMKVMDKRILISRKQVFSVFREKAALAHVTHPFIVSLKYALETEHLLLLVCDFEKGGNMYSNVIAHGAYPLDRTRMYAAQMVLAIAQVHEMGVLYRDMKPDNILLDADGHCKLADMGAARGERAGGEMEIDGLSEENRHKTLRPSELQATMALEQLETHLEEHDIAADAGVEKDVPRSLRMTITGTHGYRAPEVYMRSYGKSADWWNLGLLILEMLTGKPPTDLRILKETRLTSLTPPRTQGRDMSMQVLQTVEPAPETNKLDYYCEMVDYLRASKAARKNWRLSPDDQESFRGFAFASLEALREELFIARGPGGRMTAGGNPRFMQFTDPWAERRT
ncbi:kinase-like domain-containing protein [Pavlovales sp. CCMP2436]|nr:kinase-like domain-containing protein [Pavlovales sp. CCMP2436]